MILRQVLREERWLGLGRVSDLIALDLGHHEARILKWLDKQGLSLGK